MKFKKLSNEIYISCKDKIIYEISDGFLSLTGYSPSELIGKSIEQLGALLRLNSQIALEDLNASHNLYLFTKENKAKEINISSKYFLEEDILLYTFKELSNLILNNLLENIFSFDRSSKKAIALYSLEDLILLQSNKEYSDLLSSLNISTSSIIGNSAPLQSLLFDPDNENLYNNLEVEFICKNGSSIYLDISTVCANLKVGHHSN